MFAAYVKMNLDMMREELIRDVYPDEFIKELTSRDIMSTSERTRLHSLTQRAQKMAWILDNIRNDNTKILIFLKSLRSSSINTQNHFANKLQKSGKWCICRLCVH